MSILNEKYSFKSFSNKINNQNCKKNIPRGKEAKQFRCSIRQNYTLYTCESTKAHSMMPASPLMPRRHASANLTAAYACILLPIALNSPELCSIFVYNEKKKIPRRKK